MWVYHKMQRDGQKVCHHLNLVEEYKVQSSYKMIVFLFQKSIILRPPDTNNSRKIA